jgi:preprotein translocase subunit SecG
MSLLLGLLTGILIFVSLFLILVVLMQKSKDGGMGAALGGGAAEAAFGADTSNVLSRATRWGAIAFFLLAFVLYLGRIYERNHARDAAGNALPALVGSPAAPAAATPAPSSGSTTTTVPLTVPATSTTAPAADAATSTAPATAPATQTPAPTTPAPETPKK